MTRPDEQDTAREVRPLVMFDDRKREQGGNVKDFRPISEYAEQHRGSGDHLGGDLSKLDGGQVLTQDDSEPQTDVDDEEGTPLPPDDAPEEEPVEGSNGGSTGTNESADDIPSPWDEPTSSD